MATRDSNAGLWNFVNRIKGDKVIWMVALMLIMISIVAVSSSTSLLARSDNSERLDIMKRQWYVATAGLIIMILIYNLGSLKVFRWFSKQAYLLSMILLLMLASKVNIHNIIRVETINGAVRTIRVAGLQVHVFEAVKVLMIMYMAWAVDAYKKREFKLTRWLSTKKHLGFFKREIARKITYFWFPILSVCLLIVGGSMTTALFLGVVLGIIAVIGGVGIKEILPVGLVAVVALFACIVLHYASGQTMFSHIGTAINRIGEKPEKIMAQACDDYEAGKIRYSDYKDLIDKTRQPIGAKLAISESSPLGRGPGRSKQKYVVPVMFGDYMYAFIIEEYGFLGAILVLILYGSLFARGHILARNCPDLFSQAAVGGLVILIAGQALIHMLVNVGVGPLTGQTLPMISHGTSSFLMFSIAFGIILSISKIVKRRIDEEIKNTPPIMASDNEDIQGRMNDLDQLDSL